MSEARKLRLLRKALDRARLDFDQTIEACRTGAAQVHEHPRAVAITALAVSGPYKTCHIVAVGGALDALAELEATIVAFAQAAGCQCIDTDGRLGWDRIGRQAEGYKPVSTKYRKEI